MENQNITVKVEDGVKSLDIRHGRLPDIELPRPIRLQGNIYAPADFIAKRRHVVDAAFKDTTHVLVNRRNLTITLEIDEQSERGYQVVGRMQKNPDLAAFGINSNKEFTLAELVRLVRLNSLFFNSRDEYTGVASGLMNFSAQSKTQMEVKNDNRGNSLQKAERTSELNVQLAFSLNMPIYEGTPKVVFPVYIFFNVQDNNVRFWLESTELREMEVTLRDLVFDESLLPLRDYAAIEQ